MSKQDIIKLIKSITSKNNSLPLDTLLKIKSISNIDLEIDRNTNEYYYKIDIDNLVGKDFDKNLFTDYGWKLSDNEDFLMLNI